MIVLDAVSTTSMLRAAVPRATCPTQAVVPALLIATESGSVNPEIVSVIVLVAVETTSTLFW